jgi:hypothetical protein
VGWRIATIERTNMDIRRVQVSAFEFSAASIYIDGAAYRLFVLRIA